MQVLKTKIDDYPGNKGYRIFAVSDIDEATAATLRDHDIRSA